MTHKTSLEALDRTMKVYGTIKIDDFVSRRFSSNITSDSKVNAIDELNACLTFDRTKSVGVASMFM